jgi:hypothetical protein
MIFISERGLQAQVSEFPWYRKELPEKQVSREPDASRVALTSSPGTKKKSPAKASDRNLKTLKL